MAEYGDSALRHYQFLGEHLQKTKGYEYYVKMNEKLHTYGDEKAIEFFADLQVYGTPEQVHAKIVKIHEQTANKAFVGVFSYAGMPHAEAVRNMTQFAREVMPEVKKIEVGEEIDCAVDLPDHRFARAAE